MSLPLEWQTKWAIWRWDPEDWQWVLISKGHETRGRAHQWGGRYRQERAGYFDRGSTLHYVEYKERA